jgi:hypothetical protein
MIRNRKTLGLVLAAVLAIGGLSASNASAASFHSEVEHTIIDGEQSPGTNDLMRFNAGTWTCNSITYTGTTTTATNTSLTVTPTWKECTAFGFVNITIDVNGCTYVFNAGGSFQISCPGNPITVTAFNCHIKIGSQTFPSGITYDNAGTGTGRDMSFTINFSGLTYTQESKSFPGCSNGTFNNGTYEGNATVTGTDTAGSPVGVWRS